MKRIGMTVAELRRALDDVPDKMLVTIRASSDDGNSICGAITFASVEAGCAENEDGGLDPSFVIDASDHIETVHDADRARRSA